MPNAVYIDGYCSTNANNSFYCISFTSCSPSRKFSDPVTNVAARLVVLNFFCFIMEATVLLKKCFHCGILGLYFIITYGCNITKHDGAKRLSEWSVNSKHLSFYWLLIRLITHNFQFEWYMMGLSFAFVPFYGLRYNNYCKNAWYRLYM